MKFDQESMWGALLSVMTTNGALNTKIAAIDTDKGVLPDGALAQVASTGYFLEVWKDKILNISPAVYYGTDEITTIKGAHKSAKVYTAFVTIIYTDNGQYDDSANRISRYARALEELFNECNPQDYGFPVPRLDVESIEPFAFRKSTDVNEDYLVAGIKIKISLV